MHNIPFIPGGIDNLSRDSRSISRDVSVLYRLNTMKIKLICLPLFSLNCPSKLRVPIISQRVPVENVGEIGRNNKGTSLV